MTAGVDAVGILRRAGKGAGRHGGGRGGRLGWAGSVAVPSGGTAAWSAATIDGGSASLGPCAASPVRGEGRRSAARRRLFQPRARDSMTARAALRADRLLDRAKALL